MPTDPRVDAYIAAAAPFAQPILRHLRARVHAACPEASEAIKWGRPFFLIDGRPLAMMAAFKAHAAFGFWGNGGLAEPADGAGDYGKLVSADDLPDGPQLDTAIAAAAARSRAGAPARARGPRRPEAPVPADLATALDDEPAAAARWTAFAPGQRREYVEWIEEAKRPETRARRVTEAAARVARGETRNAKYERKAE